MARPPELNREQSLRRVRYLLKKGCKVRVVETRDGTIILKKCPPGARVGRPRSRRK